MATRIPEELERLVREALDREASDLFLIPGEPPTMRVRPDFELERTDAEPLSAEDVRRMAAAVIGEENLAKVGPELGKFQQWCGWPGEYNLSACVARADGEYTMVLRVMLSWIPDIEQVLLPQAMVDAGLAPNGLVVFSGAVGSGKTTGLYSLLDHINEQKACHICTVETPNHLRLTPKKALIQQRQVGVDVPNTLAGIDAARHQDLDVLFVDEITTVEELQACIAAAETGHLVLTQLHSPTPEDAVQRMIDVFPEDIRPASCKALARVLRAVSAQRLLPRADGKGRVAAYAVLAPDDETRAAIAEGRDILTRKAPWPDECQTLSEHIERLESEGTITDEVAAAALAQL